MFDQSLNLLSQSDTFAVIEFLDQQENQLQVAKTYSELVKHLYWKEKNVPDMVALARAGIQYALAAGSSMFKRDLVMTLLLRSEAKSIAYNLASFTWIGWDEPGITLDETDQCYGLEAARMNAADLAKSRESFQRAATYAVRAGEKGDELIARGFELLVDLLQDPHSLRTKQAMANMKDQLLQIEHGQMYVDQIDTAWTVFG
jgi:hypothetical protein